MADDAAATDQQISFIVKASNDSRHSLTLPLTTTIGDLKTKLSASDYADIEPHRQRLIYSGRVLKDADTLADCKIKEGNTVHLVKGADSNNRQNPANQGGSTPIANAGQPAANVPTNIAAGTGANNPLAQLTGARYAGFHQLPGADMFGADGGMGAGPNPDDMLRMLDDPNQASMISEAMNNPAVLDMLRNSPMIRNNPLARQAIEDPDMRRMLFDPNMIRMQANMQRGMRNRGSGGVDFPAPGITDTTEGVATGAVGAGAQPQGAAGTGAGTQVVPPSTDTAQGNQPSPSGAAPANANPFASLFGGGAGGAGSSFGFASNELNPMGAMARQMMQNPGMMQDMMRMLGGAGGAGAGDQVGGGGMGGLGGLGGMGADAQPQEPADSRPPEERYESQLRQLNDMGFFEFDRNVQALRRSGGNVNGAVEWLLSNPS